MTDMMEVERATLLLRIADHNVFPFVVNLDVPRQQPHARRVYDYKRAPWNIICVDLASRDWSWIRFSCVDDATVRFTNEILATLEARVPSKLISDRAAVHPWYNEHCRELIQRNREAEGTPAYASAVEHCSR